MRKIINTILAITLIWTALNTNAYTHYYKSEEDLYNYRKAIVVDTKEWTAKAFFYWKIVWQFPVSTWNRYNPTPHWRFKIVNKNPMMKSVWSWLFMPYRMEFYWYWKYWFHWFPLYPDMTPKYPNEESAVREKASWWCVRLKKDHIKRLYEWTDPLTTVIII